MESPDTLLRDLAETKPQLFFAAPRIWERLSQYVLEQFGGHDALNQQLAEDREGTRRKAQEMLGLTDADYLMSASAPIPPSLIHWAMFQ